MKICTNCKKEKDVDQFRRRPRTKDRLSCWCKECDADYMAKYYINNPKKFQEATAKHNWKKYGVSPEQYAQMLKDQDNKCAICKDVNKNGRALAIDHAHTTGKVRGLLCITCNIRLGIKENIEFNCKADEYLLKYESVLSEEKE